MQISGKIEAHGIQAAPKDLPYPISDTRARITIADSVATIEHIEGYLDGDPVDRPLCPMHVSGKVYLDKDVLDYKINLALDHFNVDDRLTAVILPFQRPMFRVAGPVGWMQFQATVVPPPDPEVDPRPFYQGVMDVQDVTFDIQPKGSPFRCVMPNLSGRIEASSGTLRNGHLAGRDEKGRTFELRGDVFNMNVEGAMLFNIAVSVDRIDLASEVRAFLTRPTTIAGFERWGPTGVIDVWVNFRKLENDPDRVIKLKARVHEASIAPTIIDYKIEGINGGELSLDTEAGEIRVKDLSAEFDGCRIGINGLIKMRETTPVRFLELVGENLPIDDKLRRAVYSLDSQTGERPIQLPDLPGGLGSLRELWDMFNPWGRVDLTARIVNDADGAAPEITGLFRVRKAGLYIPLLPFPLSDIQGGEIELADGTLEVRNLVAREGDMVVSLAGKLTGIEPGNIENVQGELTLSAERLHLSDVGALLTQTLAPLAKEDAEIDAKKISDVWNSFSPRGEVDVLARVRKFPGADPLESIDIAMDVKIRDAGFSYLDRLDITDVGGEIYMAGQKGRRVQGTASDGEVRSIDLPPRSAALVGIVGRHGRATLAIDGLVAVSDEGPSFEVQLAASDVSIDADLLQFIEDETLRGTLARINPTGRVSIEVEGRGTLGEGGIAGINAGLSGKLALQEGGLTAGMVFHDMSALMVIDELSLRQGAFSARGSIFSKGLAVKKTEVRNLSLSFELSDVDPKEGARQVVFTGMRGELCGGSLTGDAKIDIAPGAFRYGLDLHIQDVQMETLLRSAMDYEKNDFVGRVNGDILIQGEGLSPENLVASGRLALSDGKLWEQPIALKVFHALSLSPVDQYAFRSADMAFRMGRGDVFVDDMRLEGKAMTVYGKGTVREQQQIDFVFILGSGTDNMPLIPIMEDIKKQMVNVRVRGDLNDFEARVDFVAPISGPVSDFLEDLLRRD